MAALLLSVLCLTGCSDGPVYEVILPVGYEESVCDYPVIYVLPQDGHYLDTSGITEQLVQKMENGEALQAIIIKPEFMEDSDIMEDMTNIVQEVDAEYKTIENKKYRALIGTGTGGYLAYAVGLEERSSVLGWELI